MTFCPRQGGQSAPECQFFTPCYKLYDRIFRYFCSMKIRRNFLALCLATMASLAMPARTTQPLQGQWSFARADSPQQWQPITIPHSWNAHDGTSPHYYRGAATYRCRFDAPRAGAHDRTFIRFEAVSQDATVWLNGHKLGRHQGAFTAFCFELTHLLKPRANELRVEVTNAPDPMIMPLDGDFTIFGGIYRPVSLLVLPATCFTPLDYASSGIYISQTDVNHSQAHLDVKARIDTQTAADDLQLRTTVHDPQGRQVLTHTQQGARPGGKFIEFDQRLTIDHPRLWDGIGHAERYRFVFELLQDGRVVDTLSQTMGLRYFSVDPERGFSLNGRSYPLHGVNRHQDRQGMGWAITEREHDEDMALIQEIGANSIRLAHYPHSSYFYNLCDRAGMLVWAEIPYIGKGTRAAAFDANAMQQLTELIRQNYNHESIFCWSLFNELGGPDRPDELVAMLNELAHREDPTRLTVAAANNDGRPENDMTDIMAYNTYPGWYWSDPNGMKWAIEWKLGKGRAIAISEYGAGASIRQHDQHITQAPKTDGPWHPEQWQATVHEGNYAQIVAHPALWASFVWNMFDFASASRHEGDTMGINDKGLVTYDRKVRKDAFYFYKANWSKQPMVYITSRRHTTRTEPLTDIKVYSNCPCVTIVVNGVPVEVESRGMGIFVARGAHLQPGDNTIVASGVPACQADTITDQCVWTFKTD